MRELLEKISGQIGGLVERIENIESRLEQLPKEKVYAFPQTKTLEEWVRLFGPTAAEAGINKQLIVNVVQGCQVVLKCCADKSTMLPPDAFWSDSYLGLQWERNGLSLEMRITTDPYRYDWKMYGKFYGSGHASFVCEVPEHLRSCIEIISKETHIWHEPGT